VGRQASPSYLPTVHRNRRGVVGDQKSMIYPPAVHSNRGRFVDAYTSIKHVRAFQNRKLRRVARGEAGVVRVHRRSSRRATDVADVHVATKPEFVVDLVVVAIVEHDRRGVGSAGRGHREDAKERHTEGDEQ